ncbi:MAG: Fimbrial assembly family protein [Candidatus Saccharibacteria bacterium]|nr:Fimbrial assembly family protein [Candidatus Saccharibacteria bacterium]
MINLMPDGDKRELRAARTNVLLIRYITVIFLAAAFLGLILFGSIYLLDQTRLSSQNLIDANSTKASVFNETKAQVDALSGQLTETKNILDQEVLYSKVLTNIAQTMPAGTILDKLTLDSASLLNNTPTSLKIYAKKTDDAVKLQNNFQSSPFFANVTFQDLTDNGGAADSYPVSATMTLTLTKAITQ